MSKKFVLTERDYDILENVALYGGLTSMDISTLLFPPAFHKGNIVPHTNCQERLKGLFKERFLERIEQASIRSKGTRRNIHVLTTRGARVLAAHRACQVEDLAWRKMSKDSRDLFLEHRMWVNQVRVAITHALLHSSYQAHIATWIDDAGLKHDHSGDKMSWRWPSGRVEENTVLVPDSYFHVHITHPVTDDYHQFLETDRGTTTGMSSSDERRTWERRIRMYLEYRAQGFYHDRYHTNDMRVMTVTTSQKRLAHLKHITERAGGKSRFYFTTLEDIHKGVERTKRAVALIRDSQEKEENDRIVTETILTDYIWQRATLDGLHPFIIDEGA